MDQARILRLRAALLFCDLVTRLVEIHGTASNIPDREFERVARGFRFDQADARTLAEGIEKEEKKSRPTRH